jgi:acylglycerol lipase
LETKNQPVATLCLIHGIGDHSGRYDALARHFCKHNILVCAIDYRGNGRSPGKQGHINHLEELLDDVEVLVRWCKRIYAHLPTFIYGHSMGGNLVLNYLIHKRQDFAGAIITAPWLGLVKPPSAWELWAGRIVNTFYPAFTMSTGIKSNHLSSGDDSRPPSEKDPLMHGKITVRTFLELDKSVREIIVGSEKIITPLIICHGSADTITDQAWSQNLANTKPQLFKFVPYPDACHELHNDPLSANLFNDLLTWILEQIEIQSRMHVSRNVYPPKHR